MQAARRGVVVTFSCLCLVLALGGGCGDNLMADEGTAPAAADDTATTAEDTPVVIPGATLLANDTDAEGATLTVTAVGTPSSGTAIVVGGDVTYTPAADFVGTATFAYTVSDGDATDTATVTVTVTPVNDAPIAVDDVAATGEDIAVEISTAQLVANDTDVDGDTLTVTEVATPSSGTAVLAGGAVTFTPAAGFNGTATFAYTVSDGTLTDTATVTVTVTNPPVAVDDVATTAEDTAVVITGAQLVANDTDADGDTLTVTAVGTPSTGTATLAAGDVTYTPAADFTGAATFVYTVSDGALTDTATVTVTVTPVNDPPVAVADAVTTAEDTSVVIAGTALVANDVDVDGDPLIVTAVDTPSSGTAMLAGGNVTYTPAANFTGTATFGYAVSDGTETDTALVTVTVTPVNDPPVAVDDTATTSENTAVAILATTLVANDTDLDGGALSVTAVGSASNGSVMLGGGIVTFTPATDFVGAATFTYTVSDGAGGTDTGLVTVTVTPLGVVMIAAGVAHTCALVETAQVRCWGENGQGQLGLGDAANRGDGPGEMGGALPAVALGAGRTATAIVAGGYHTCALLDDGTVKCWGNNGAGQLGQGDVAHRGDAPGELGALLLPIALGTGRSATAIAAGDAHTCALLDDATVKCWGENDHGQLGLGDVADRGDAAGELGDVLPAVNLGTGRTATALAVGAAHTCALLDDATVKCWGYNLDGELGQGDALDRGDGANELGDVLLAISLGGGRTVTSLAAGAYHTCAVLDDATVKCWGYNVEGQLGLGDVASRGDGANEMGESLPVVSLGAGVTANALAAGGFHSCALLDDATLKCWGFGGSGQLGLGDVANRGDGPGELGDALPAVDL